MNPREILKLIPQILTIPFLTLVSYPIYLANRVGYFSYFDIPFDFIKVSSWEVVQFILGFILLLFIVIITTDLLCMFLSQKSSKFNKFYEYSSWVNKIPLYAIPFTLIYFLIRFFHNEPYIYSLVAFVSNLLSVIFFYMRFSPSRKNENSKSERIVNKQTVEDLKKNIENLQFNMHKLEFFLIFTIYLYFLQMSYDLGRYNANSKNIFTIISENENHFVVLSKAEDMLITKKVNLEDKKIENKIKIYSIQKIIDNNLIISRKSIFLTLE